MHRQVAILLVILLVGCDDNHVDTAPKREHGTGSPPSSLLGAARPGYHGGNAAYHRYTGTDIYPVNPVGAENARWVQPPLFDGSLRGWSYAPMQTRAVPNLNALNDYSARINARRIELDRLLHELDREQQYFNAELGRVAAEYEDSRRAISLEYNSLNSIMRAVAPTQLNNPPEGVYVNAYPQVPWIASNPFVQRGIIQPFIHTVPPQIYPVQPTVVTPAIPTPQLEVSSVTSVPPTPLVVTENTAVPIQTVIPDFGLFISSLLQFIDTCISLVSLSTSRSNLETELLRIRSSVLSLRASGEVDVGGKLASLAREVNSLLPKINALPRRTVSEVWIDPLRVSSRDERNKLDRLVQQEAKETVSLSQSGFGTEEVNIESSIPNMFTIAGTARTSHHRLKVLWDVKSKQVKLVAVCHRREFHRNSDKPRWFFAFTCDDHGGSMRALADPGRNHLTQAVLKVVCHSKEFARRLVLESVHREDRCMISKWSTIAQGLGEPKFSKLDRHGRNIWRSLIERRGCFDSDESRIHSRCNSKP